MELKSIVYLTTVAVLSISLYVTAENVPYFSELAQDQTHFQGALTEFRWVSVGYNIFAWYMNNQLQIESNVSNGDIIFERIRNGTHIVLLKVTVQAHLDYSQYTFAYSGLLYSSEMNKYLTNRTAPVTLHVQGVPSSITDFSGTNTSSTSIVFNWSAPKHLSGLEPCCLSYYVNITHYMSSDQIFNGNITAANLSFNITKDRLCDVLVVNIFAYNRVGKGDLFARMWSLGGFFTTSSVIPTLYYTTDNTFTMNINVQIIGYCLSDLNNVTVIVTCNINDTQLITVEYINVLSNDEPIERNITLSIPPSQHDQYCMWHIALDNNVDNNGAINTFDVIGARVTETGPGFVCIICSYVTSSIARGCHLNATLISDLLLFDDDIQTSYTVNISRRSREGCINVTNGGLYMLLIHDWNINSISTLPAVNIPHVMIDPPLSSTPEIMISELSTEAVVGITVSGTFVGVLVIGVVIVLLVCVCLHGRRRNTQCDSNHNFALVTATSGTEPFYGNDEVDGQFFIVNDKEELDTHIATDVNNFYERFDTTRFRFQYHTDSNDTHLIIKITPNNIIAE